MKTRLGLRLEPWAREALGHLTGSPYTGAEKVHGKQWRADDKDRGQYPAALVCDQLGEVTQQMFRGMEGYGSGLLGHYAYYQKNDSVFFPAVPDGDTIPANYTDKHCAPGATLFNIGAPGKGRDFESHAMNLLTTGESYTNLYDNGVPRQGKSAAEAKKAVQDKAKALRPSAQKLEEAAPGLGTEDKQYMRDQLIEVMEQNFYPDKWIVHEYTILAVAPQKTNTGGKLLFLDTFGNEKENEPLICGAAQPHWSNLKTIQGKDDVCWGFVEVQPHQAFTVESLASEGRPPQEMETENHASEAETGQVTPDETASETTKLVLPHPRVMMNIAGRYNSYSFEIQPPAGQEPPPAVVYEYALEKLTSVRDFKIWIEFYGSPANGEDTLLKEIRLEEPGQAIWHRPLWMTEKFIPGDLKKEQKEREKFFGKESGK